MKALIWIKESFVSILLATVGILAVAAVHFRHTARAAKDEIKRTHQTIKQNRAEVKAINEANKRLKEQEDEIQSPNFDPTTDFIRRDK